MSRPFNRRGLLGVFALAPLAAAPVIAAPHPDADLLAASARSQRADRDLEAARAAVIAAGKQIDPVLMDRPAVLIADAWEDRAENHPCGPLRRMRVALRYTPPRHEGEFSCRVWTGKALRNAIASAVPVLGQGGITPHRIRRWKAMLPSADAFDARVQAVEARTDYRSLQQRKFACEREAHAALVALTGCVATTPEGLAVLVRRLGLLSWKDAGGPWPNLLRSAANVSGVGLDELEHRYASARGGAACA